MKKSDKRSENAAGVMTRITRPLSFLTHSFQVLAKVGVQAAETVGEFLTQALVIAVEAETEGHVVDVTEEFFDEE